MKITVFGDSVLKGVITTPQTTSLFDVTENDSLSLAQKELGFELDNRSIYGNIITKGQLKFNKWLEKGGSADICIIEFGDNDSDYDWPPISQNPDGEYDYKTPLQDYLRILKEMTDSCKKNKILPILASVPALIPERWINSISKGLNKENIIKFLGGDINKLSQNQELYYKAMQTFASKNKIKLVDMRQALINEDNYADLICMDGIHPSEAGYKLMSQVWIKELPEIFKEIQ